MAKDGSKTLKYEKVHLMMMPTLVWICRVIVGGVFIFSGFAKCIDPWGFIFKIEEYLQVWGIHWLWRETVLCIAVTVSCVEFCAGVALLTGCLRRSVCWLLALFMAVMLPLTAYVAIANPVPDCGCFGDALIISNTATFIKNIFLTAAIIYLSVYNSHVKGLYPPLSQALPIMVSLAFCLFLSFIGITIQPMVDFRHFKVGTPLVEDADTQVSLIYEKDGKREAFDVDNLPDSTWRYVARQVAEVPDVAALAVFDGDDEVTDEVIAEEGQQVLLIVPDISHYGKTRASMANNINDYVTSLGGTMIGIVGVSGDALDRWRSSTKPHFPVYSSDESTLKEIVRGDAGIVYLDDGVINWKRSMYSLPGDFPDFLAKENQLKNIKVVDSGTLIRNISAIYVAILFGLFLLGLIRVKNDKKSAEKKT